MAKTIKGSTPTFTFTFDDYDPTTAAKVVVTFAKENGNVLFELWEDELEITSNSVSCYLTQAQTLSFPKGDVKVQLNFVYDDGSRVSSEEKTLNWERNLHNEVIEV